MLKLLKKIKKVIQIKAVHNFFYNNKIFSKFERYADRYDMIAIIFYENKTARIFSPKVGIFSEI